MKWPGVSGLNLQTIFIEVVSIRYDGAILLTIRSAPLLLNDTLTMRSVSQPGFCNVISILSLVPQIDLGANAGFVATPVNEAVPGLMVV